VVVVPIAACGDDDGFAVGWYDALPTLEGGWLRLGGIEQAGDGRPAIEEQHGRVMTTAVMAAGQGTNHPHTAVGQCLFSEKAAKQGKRRRVNRFFDGGGGCGKHSRGF